MCLYLKEKESGSFAFSLQWHITAKCDQHCKHCYMYNSPTYNSEIRNELSLSKCKLIIDDYLRISTNITKGGTIVFAGGDPLLREDFFDILKYASKSGVSTIAIIGNSYHVDLDTARRLKENGVCSYQLSLDGMKDIHDSLRKPGSFDDTLRGFKVLKEAGLSTSCMFTISKKNAHQLTDVINLIAEIGVDSFDFGRVVPTGSGRNLINDLMEPFEYKELLLRVNEQYKRLKDTGYTTHFGFRDNLWGHLLKDCELGSFNVLPEGCELKRGCLIGKGGLVILADGKVMGCRRLPVIVGKVPDEGLADIFEKSDKLLYLKNASERICHYSNGTDKRCSGCLAVRYSANNGDLSACDPQCWIKEGFKA